MSKHKLFISKGNKKVKCNIFNLPSGSTCKNNLSCRKYCYAKKAERLYPQVLPCRTNNYLASLEEDFISRTVDSLKKRKINITRLHEAGDFYSIEYTLNWFTICDALPDHQFYAYTKQREIVVDACKLQTKPSNLTLILSIDEIQTEDKGRIENVEKCFDKVAIVHSTLNNCPAAVDDNIKCMVQCKKCLSKKREIIIFKKH
jgi:hypothetical protein